MFCYIKYGCYSKTLLIIKKGKAVFASINDLHVFVYRQLLVYFNSLLVVMNSSKCNFFQYFAYNIAKNTLITLNFN